LFREVISLCPGAYAYALSNRKDTFAIYLTGGVAKTINLTIPAGKYQVQWLNPADGTVSGSETVDAQMPSTIINMPDYSVDMAVKLTKVNFKK